MADFESVADACSDYADAAAAASVRLYLDSLLSKMQSAGDDDDDDDNDEGEDVGASSRRGRTSGRARGAAAGRGGGASAAAARASGAEEATLGGWSSTRRARSTGRGSASGGGAVSARAVITDEVKHTAAIARESLRRERREQSALEEASLDHSKSQKKEADAGGATQV